MRNIAVLLVALFTAIPLFAADEMRRLDFLAGEWKGEAWAQMGPEKKEHILQHERVQPKLGGQVLLVEGLGKSPEGKVVHDALAVISWNEEKKTYRFATWVAGRPEGETTLDLIGPNTAVWAMETPRGRMRYTIRLIEKGEWNEIGEFSRDDGATWLKFFEMTLTKQ